MNSNYPNLDNYKGLIKWAVIIILAAVLVFNSFYTINEQEAAVVTTFGIASASTESGLHFKIPFVQQVTKVDTTIKGFPIGYDAYTNNTIEDESLMITSDFNFVNVDFYVEYRVTDPVKALYASENYEAVLKTIAQSSIRAEIGSYPVDSVITPHRGWRNCFETAAAHAPKSQGLQSRWQGQARHIREARPCRRNSGNVYDN